MCNLFCPNLSQLGPRLKVSNMIMLWLFVACDVNVQVVSADLDLPREALARGLVGGDGLGVQAGAAMAEHQL